MSTNWFDTDRNRELVPSRLSDDAELDALIDVLARHRHATLQVIARGATDRRRVLEKSLARGVPVMSLGDGVGGITDTDLPVYRLGGGAEPFSPRLGFESTIAAAAVPAWHEMINGPAENKLGLLADPSWRARARHDWDNPLDEQNAFRKEQLHALILSDSENGTGPEGISLQGPRRAARAAPVGRVGRLGARERHRVALHEALGAAARHPARDGRAGQGRLRRPVRAHRRHRRGRAPQHVLRRRRERLRAHALGARRGAPSASSRPSTA